MIALLLLILILAPGIVGALCAAKGLALLVVTVTAACVLTLILYGFEERGK